MFRTVPAFLSLLLAASPILARPQDKPDAPEEEPQEPEEKGRPANANGYSEYMEVTEATYVAATAEGGQQAIQLKFNLVTDIPKGCKIHIGLEYNALPIDENDYVLKDENRKGLSLTWKAKRHLATGEYRLRTSIDLESQTPAVQKLIKQNAKVFPPKEAPWPCYPKKAVQIGGPEDEKKETEAMCGAYTALLDKLSDNWKEFKIKLNDVKAGKELVSGGTLDATKLEAYVKQWREKQGAVQKEILEFPVEEPALMQKAQTAQVKIMAFGCMVSKCAVQLQKEVTDHYKVPVINPAVKYFNKSYPYKAKEEDLQKNYEEIQRAAGCDSDEAEDGAGDGDGAKPADADPAGGDAKDAPKGEDPAPGKEKKKAAKKTEKAAK